MQIASTKQLRITPTHQSCKILIMPSNMENLSEKKEIERLIQLRKLAAKLEQAVARANDFAIAAHLAGLLDPNGHKVEIREKNIGKRIVKSLIIDGEG